jgi:hypothetical protein
VTATPRKIGAGGVWQEASEAAKRRLSYETFKQRVLPVRVREASRV